MVFWRLNPAESRNVSIGRFNQRLMSYTYRDLPMLDRRCPKRVLDGFFKNDRRHPAGHLEICWRSIKLAFALIGRRGERIRFHILPSAAMQFVQLADHHVGRAPIRCVAIHGSAGSLFGGKQRLAQHQAAIQLFVQDLKDDSRKWRLLDQFPKVRRTSAIKIIIAVMV